MFSAQLTDNCCCMTKESSPEYLQYHMQRIYANLETQQSHSGYQENHVLAEAWPKNQKHLLKNAKAHAAHACIKSSGPGRQIITCSRA